MATYLTPEELAIAQDQRRQRINRWLAIRNRQRSILTKQLFNRRK